MPRASTKTRILMDPEEIREWAEERGARPARVKGTGDDDDDDAGIIRLDFPGYSGADSLEPISWDEWLRKFEQSNLALLVQDQTAGGQRSNFNKLINRETAQQDEQARGRAASRRVTARSVASKKASGRKSTAQKSTSKRGSRASTKKTTSARGSSRAKRSQSARRRTGSRHRAA